MTAAPERSEWVVFACRTTFAGDVAEIIWRRGELIAFLVDNLPDGPEPSPIGTVVSIDDLPGDGLSGPVVIPLTTPGFRCSAETEARGRGARSFPALRDPTSTIARTAVVAEGCVVNAGAVIGANSQLGRFVHVNRSASVGHDVAVDDYATLGPACVVSGAVRIQRGAFIGSGAVCAPGVAVGSNAVVGAGAVVLRDVAANTVVVGNPARVIRTDKTGYGGASVPVEP
jgi:sugar O-acyltransferase (sialic acid O-acetyltransferase NeuD family)